MANRGAPSSGGYGPQNPSPYWNAQAELEIDVWNPPAASSNATSAQQVADTGASHWGGSSTTGYQGVAEPSNATLTQQSANTALQSHGTSSAEYTGVPASSNATLTQQGANTTSQLRGRSSAAHQGDLASINATPAQQGTDPGPQWRSQSTTGYQGVPASSNGTSSQPGTDPGPQWRGPSSAGHQCVPASGNATSAQPGTDPGPQWRGPSSAGHQGVPTSGNATSAQPGTDPPPQWRGPSSAGHQGVPASGNATSAQQGTDPAPQWRGSSMAGYEAANPDSFAHGDGSSVTTSNWGSGHNMSTAVPSQQMPYYGSEAYSGNQHQPGYAGQRSNLGPISQDRYQLDTAVGPTMADYNPKPNNMVTHTRNHGPYVPPHARDNYKSTAQSPSNAAYNANPGEYISSQALDNNMSATQFPSNTMYNANPAAYISTQALDNTTSAAQFSSNATYNANPGGCIPPHAPDNSNWTTPLTSNIMYDANPEISSYDYYSSKSTVSSFKNPLMNDNKEDSVNDAESLIRNMRIEGQKAQQQMQNMPRYPCILSKASMAMLKKDLDEAAVVFSSPESLKLARERELGLLDDVGVTVVVSNLSVSAADFIPRTKSPTPEHIPQQAPPEEEAGLIENLESFIANVLMQPGNFDNLSAVFVNRVEHFLHSDDTVKEMVRVIFTKAIDEENFKYLGARLCDQLTKPKILPSFRPIFLNHLQTKHKSIQALVELVEDAEKNVKEIHGFYMFMAEIFIHIKINNAPIKALGRSLSRSFEKLLDNPTPANVTFVCKTLKLAGGKLLDAFEGDATDMENYQKTFTILKEFSDKQKDATDETNKRMMLLISSVCRLKDSNWGRTMSNTRAKSSIDDPEQYGENLSELDQNYYMNEPVFFTPDGVQYTAAEAQLPEFYEQHLAKFNLQPDAASSDNSCHFPWSQSDGGFDDLVPSDEEVEYYRQDSEEIEYVSEYEKFLAESGQLS